MATALINGKRVQIPDSSSTDDIRKAGKIKNGRTLIHRKRDGNYALRSGAKVNVKDGDTFTDAPARTKG